MRINGHAHIFSLNAVLSTYAIRIVVNRIREKGLPAFVVDAVEKLLNEQMKHPENLTEDELLDRFIGYIAGSPAVKKIIPKKFNLPFGIQISGSRKRAMKRSALQATLDRLSSAFDRGAEAEATIKDVFQTLRIALLPSSVRVAERLFEETGPGEIMTALMMDITSEATAAADHPLFVRQMRELADAAVAFPGRIIPFVAVNTRREDYFELMRRGIEEFGFAGIKLYPSLGVSVTTSRMKRVFDYCLEKDLPILLHCNQGGFHESAASVEFCNPEHWRAILKDRPGLRVCFAHAGGTDQGVMKKDGPEKGDWTHTIEELIEQYDQVYMDISYHTDQMLDEQHEKNYLAWLRKVLKDGKLKKRVIFGTDGWLLRLNLPDSLYINWFEDRLTNTEMELIYETAPAEFLGLPVNGNKKTGGNIRNLVSYLDTRPSVGEQPAEWLIKASETSWSVSRKNQGWSPNNHLHMLTYSFFTRYMTRPQKELNFADAGDLLMRQFTWWNREQVSAKVFRNDRRNVALQLISLCKGSGMRYEDGHTQQSAMEQISSMLGDETKNLAAIGSTLDSIYRFSPDVS
jgi:predicted TIM-barrel fold metal-dependent hydrolase